MKTSSDKVATLDDDTLAMLLSEVSAMVSSRRPLSAGLADLDGMSLGKLGRAAHSIRVDLNSGKSAEEAIASMSGRYQAPVRVAMEVMSRTRSTEPVYEVVRLIRESCEQRRQFRLASINPLLNTLVSAAILFYVLPWLLFSIASASRNRDVLSPTMASISEQFFNDYFLAACCTVIVVALMTAVLYWAFSRFSGEGTFARDYAVFCRWMAMQVRASSVHGTADGEPLNSNGVDLATAIESSAEVVGPDFATAWRGVAERIRAGTVSGDAMAMPTGTPVDVRQCLIDLASSRRTGAEAGADLESLGRLYQEKSDRDRRWWTGAFPRALSWALMIAMMLILLRTMILPRLDVVVGVLQ